MTLTLLSDALALAANGWHVFALNGKHPFPNCSRCTRYDRHKNCQHLVCHGMLAATQEPARIAAMWALHPGANIAIRPSPGTFVLDVDPRNGGVVPDGLPETLTVESGRRDGGLHLWFRGMAPPKLGPGLDVKTWGGYVVAPPSIHPETLQPYRWVDPAVPFAVWPVELTRAAEARRVKSATGGGGRGPEIDVPWSQILEPHGWRSPGPDDWLHPRASSSLSARVIDDLLYVFSTSTDFETTKGGAPRGYGKLEAYALLNGHTNLMSAYQEVISQ